MHRLKEKKVAENQARIIITLTDEWGKIHIELLEHFNKNSITTQ